MPLLLLLLLEQLPLAQLAQLLRVACPLLLNLLRFPSLYCQPAASRFLPLLELLQPQHLVIPSLPLLAVLLLRWPPLALALPFQALRESEWGLRLVLLGLASLAAPALSLTLLS